MQSIDEDTWLSATLRSPSIFLFGSFLLFLYVLICSRGWATQMHSLCEECRGFWEQMSCWLRPHTTGPARSIQGSTLLLEFPLQIKPLLPPQTCLSKSVSGKEYKKKKENTLWVFLHSWVLLCLRDRFLWKKNLISFSYLIFYVFIFIIKCDLKICTIYYRAFIIYFCCFIVPDIDILKYENPS